MEFVEAIAPKRDLPNDMGWKQKHNAAINLPTGREFGIVTMLKGWYRYAQEYERQFESKIGDHGALGPAWKEIGGALRMLLNCDLGRLDSKTLDGFILNTIRDNGFDTERK